MCRYDDEIDYHEDRRVTDDLMFIWKCNRCGREYKDYPGYNEDQHCQCGGTYEYYGESYSL